MSTENVPRDHDSGVPIPTICLDSLNECDSRLDCSTAPGHFTDYHSFATNISHVFSWLSCFGSDRKFMVAVAMLTHCGPNFANFASVVLREHACCYNGQFTKNVSGLIEFDHISKLRWNSLPVDELLAELLKLVSYLNKSANHEIGALPKNNLGSMDSASSKTALNPFSESKANEFSHTHSVKLNALKRHYIRLLSELLLHSDELADFLDFRKTELLAETLKESLLLSRFGHILLKTMLFPPFTPDERHELITLLRTHRTSVKSDSFSSDTNVSDLENLSLILLDCILELLTDLFSVSQISSLGCGNAASSLSHSLTSSGFLSGSGGSGSQYDLLSEVSNFSSQSLVGSQYGMLLTVPSSDVRPANVCSHPPLEVKLNQRRVSDSPLFTTSCHNHSTGHIRPVKNAEELVCITNQTIRANQLPLASARQNKPPTSRASLPNALMTNHMMQTVGVQTVDSLSHSSTSSTYSSNFDLGNMQVHQLPDVHPRRSSAHDSAPLMSSSANESSAIRLLEPTSHSDLSNTETQCSCSVLSPECTTILDFDMCSFDGYHDDLIDARNRTFTQLPPRISTKSSDSYFDCAMAAVPMWLKSLRLHKYAKLFESLSYDEFLGVSEAWLQSQNVTQGARTKLLLNIRKLATRASDLAKAENLLSQSSAATPGSVIAVRHCLSQIWIVLQTPMRTCSAALSDASASIPSRTTATKHVTGSAYDVPSHQNLDGDDASQPTHTFPSVCSPTQGEYDCLPDRIMSCLTKVCSRLLVSSQPDPECCVKFVELLDIVANHPAFLDKHRSLVASWKQQMLFLRLLISPRLSPDPVHNYTNPRLSTKSWHKHVFANHRQIFKRCAGTGKRNRNRFSPPCRSNEVYRRLPEDPVPEKCQPPYSINAFALSQKNGGIDIPHFPTQSIDDSALRRHSVPVNYSHVCSPSVRPFQGKRMPSPSPHSLSFGVDGSAGVNTFPHIPSDADRRLNPQFSRARMPSPSGLDFRFLPGSSSNLAPPATAPPTRMPSPSDVNRHTHMFRFPECGYFTRPCSVSSSLAATDERFAANRMSSTLSVTSVNFDTIIPTDCHSGCSDGLTCIHVHDIALWDKTAKLSSFHKSMSNVRPGPQQLPVSASRTTQSVNSEMCPIPQRSNVHNTSGLRCTVAFSSPSNLSPSSAPIQSSFYECRSQFPSVSCERSRSTGETCDGKGGQGFEANLDYVDFDLELLTRNVTELAIGEFDSPAE